MTNDMKHIGELSCAYGTGDVCTYHLYMDETYVYATLTRRAIPLDRTSALETGRIRCYDTLNSMFWDQLSGAETEISVSPEEEFAETWLDFATEEYTNAPMTEVERSCFRNLMASCLSVLI